MIQMLQDPVNKELPYPLKFPPIFAQNFMVGSWKFIYAKTIYFENASHVPATKGFDKIRLVVTFRFDPR